MVYKVQDKDDLGAQMTAAGDKLVIIDFFATWCGPCKRISPLLDELAKEHADDLVILKVDVDELDDLAKEYKIDIMPTFVFKRNGTNLDTVTGSNEDKLKEVIKKHLPKK